MMPHKSGQGVCAQAEAEAATAAAADRSLSAPKKVPIELLDLEVSE